MPRPLPRPTDAELAILRVLWEHGPSTVRQVHEALAEARETGYTTTLKLMQIMAEKGLVTRDESRRTHVYTARLTRDADAAPARHRPRRSGVWRVGGGARAAGAQRASGLGGRAGRDSEADCGLQGKVEPMSLTAFLDHPYASALAWSLVHFLWQGAVLAVAAFACLRWLNPRASARYAHRRRRRSRRCSSRRS